MHFTAQERDSETGNDNFKARSWTESSPNTAAVAISIAHAAWEHPHLMSASPATVSGAMAAAATAARCRRFIWHR